MPRTRMDELVALAEENDGLLTSRLARSAGIQDSVLVRLAKRGRLERTARGVYRISHYPQARLSQYREAVLWAGASQGPEEVALSHETALLLYGVSDANPSRVHITVPRSTRFRRQKPGWIAVHYDTLEPADVTLHEGLPITTVERSILDVLKTTHRIDLARQVISDARRAGFLTIAQANSLRRKANQLSKDAVGGPEAVGGPSAMKGSA